MSIGTLNPFLRGSGLTMTRGTRSTFGQRLFMAMRAYELRESQRLTHARLGELVAEAKRVFGLARDGEPENYSGSAVAWWLHDRSKPDIDTCEALAHVLGVRASWLAWEDGPAESQAGVSVDRHIPHSNRPTLTAFRRSGPQDVRDRKRRGD